MSQVPEFITIPAKSNHSATVILIHGLGSNANEMKTIAEDLATDPGLDHIKWLMPQASLRPSTRLGGRVVPAWYDSRLGPDDEEGILESVEPLCNIVRQAQEEGEKRVVLGGFSQGANMSLFIGATKRDLKLSGIVMLSGRMLIPEKLVENIAPDAKDIPMFIAHGTDDKVIGLQTNRKCVDALKAAGFVLRDSTDEVGGISYYVYEGMGHSVDMQEMDDLKDWLKKNISSD
ncbi:Phospholipase/carboxylesterase/thioesterase [Desarmillaria tabescens]|uniref:Acyl-protein thioesterase 1 n=1 Tax=Armillaria tabescens TaxID=1929756 RepID=A0AA39JH44_ARMTA|nr:Phospholipase/carboxylesterase/thioesterase [Desarmillaria tabescens]KAK0442538.1 Phospholipase/carboxylesterase/thioesterase [Desarmillaria tabescens]